MANQEHLDKLKEGVDIWNLWRQEHPNLLPDLRFADLRDYQLAGRDLHRADLFETDLRFTDLSKTRFHEAKIRGADLRGANLSEADLSSADLSHADLSFSDLNHANLRHATLSDVNLSSATLAQTDMHGAICRETIFANVDLHTVRGLEQIQHRGPSSLDFRTLHRSHGTIPEAFLKGAGIDDTFIQYIHSLTNKPIHYYSCFLSYSSNDEAFAQRLYVDLQNKNVRCWFAPHDMRTGDKIRDRIDESIRVYDRLLLILSESSVQSQWVEHEVETALDKEREGHPNVLFPVRIDETILTKKTGWANHIRTTRHIGDFTHWKEHDAYQHALERLLRDLKAQA